MCGSGTLAIEAALWARDMAPGLERPRFGFERWASYDAAAKRDMLELRQAARARAKPPAEAPQITASDIADDALEAAADNARRAGVKLDLRRADVRGLRASPEPEATPGHVVTNPPYGERLAFEPELYLAMARRFATLGGHRLSILAAGPEIVAPLRLRATSSFEVYNGDIPCRLLSYEVP